MELPHETAPAGGPTPAHTHRDRTSCAFKTAPVVTVFCRFQRDVVFLERDIFLERDLFLERDPVASESVNHERKVVLVGASNLGCCVQPLRAWGIRVIDLTQPGWLASMDNIAELTKKT